MKFPLTVNDIKIEGEFGISLPLIHRDEVGCFVSIRPCADEYKGKTFLGILLGDLPMGVDVTYDEPSGVISILPGWGNPAIWVPDLKKVIMGYESWWGRIETPEQLREITDADINDVWYVKALKAMEQKS